MNKRITSLLLVLVLLISSLPLVSATDGEKGTKDNPVIISSFDDFKSFLDNPNTGSNLKYYRIDADITAPEGIIVGGGDLSNVVLEGNHHNIYNLNINGALFNVVSDASIRDINFYGATVTSEAVSADVSMAVVAQKIEGFSAFVTGCTFTDCEVKLPSVSGKVYAAMAVAENQGTITNCIVNKDCKFTNINNTACYLGGIAARNEQYCGENSIISNCISRVGFTFDEKNTTGTFGGITAVNNAQITNCYSRAYAENAENFDFISFTDNGSVEDCVYFDAPFYYTNADKSYSGSIYALASVMSQNALAYNDIGLNYSPPVDQSDYASLWTVNGNELDLSFDGKTAVVQLTLDNGFYNTEEFASVDFKPAIDSGFEITKKDSSGNISACTIKVGEYSGDEYVRNSLKVSIKVNKDYMISNDLVLNPLNASSKQTDNIFLGNGTKYSDVFCRAEVNGRISEFNVEMYPFIGKLCIDTDSSQQNVFYYKFSGEGTEESPFIISDEYELRCLSYYVSEALTYKDKNGESQNYNKAYYKLVNDIEMDSSNGPFPPIGQMIDGKDSLFCGSFDGQFHTIYNLFVDNNNDYHGLFGITKGVGEKGNYSRYAVIKNLNVFNAKIGHKEDSQSEITSSHPNIMGILAGRAEGTEISGCVTSGTVYGGTQLGGLVGYSYYCNITSSGTSADIVSYSSKAWIGGFSGYLEHSSVKNCYAAGSAVCSSALQTEYIQIGGFTGQITDTECADNYYTDTAAELWDSSVIGFSKADKSYLKSDAYIQELINNSGVYGSNCGWMKDEKGNNSGYPVITAPEDAYYTINCIGTSKGTLTADKQIAKYGESVSVTSDSKGLLEIIITDMNNNQLDKITAEGTKVSFLMDYKKSIRVLPVYEGDYLEGRGTDQYPYVIYDYGDLLLASDFINSGKSEYRPELSKELSYNCASYIIAKDIDCDGKSLDSLGIGVNFCGTFDGQGYSVSELKVNGRGFFAKTDNAAIRNLVLDAVEVSENECAVLSGEVVDSVFENIIIRNCRSGLSQNRASLVFFKINGKVKISNCLFDNNTVIDAADAAVIANDVVYGSELELHNIVFADIEGIKEGCFYDNVSRFISLTADGVYRDDSFATEESVDLELTEVSDAQLSEKAFISELSYYAENHNLNLWGQEESGRLTISYNGKPAPVSKVTYDKIFEDDVYPQLVILASLKPAYTAGELVKVHLNPRTSYVSLRVISGGKNLAYNISSDLTAEGYRTLSFIMPASSVHIDNNGEAPASLGLLGKGTEAEPYLIYNKSDLEIMAQVINNEKVVVIPEGHVEYYKAFFKLVDNVDVTGFQWKPIGIGGKNFEGTFDGNGKSVVGLTNVPFVNVLASGAEIKNVVFEAPSFETPAINYGAIGVIAIRNEGYISRCFIKGGVLCANKVNIGGIAGTTSGKIEHCAVVNTEFKHVGIYSISLFAHNVDASERVLKKSFAYNCKFDAPRSLPYYAEGENGAYDYCYFNINGTQFFYGMSPKENFNSGEIAYLMNRGVTDGSQAWYQNIDNGLTPEEYPSLVSNGYNTVYCHKVSETVYTNSATFEVFEKDKDNNFIIRSLEDLKNMKLLVDREEEPYVSASYVQGNDIICTAEDEWGGSVGDDISNPFKGTFDGRGYIIDGLTHNDGIFGYTENAVIKNLTLTNTNFNPMNIGYIDAYSGAICNYARASTISDCKVQGNLNFTNIEYAGGICGYSVAGTVENCIVEGKYSFVFSTFKSQPLTARISGICYGSAVNCANLADMVVTHEKDNQCYVGGISADNDNVINCYRYGKLTVDKADAIYNISINYENCYYLSPDSKADGGKTKAQFASGEVAYLLNKGVTNGSELWYQNIDNGKPADTYPVFEGGTVYRNSICDGKFYEYSNTPKEEVPHNYNDFNVCKRCRSLYPGKISGIYGFDIALGGNIGVNYYMVLDEKVLADPEAKLRFTVPDTGKTVTEDYLVREAEVYDGLYVFTCEVAAKEMTADIACQIITKNMAEGESDVFHYSVKTYADQLLENPESFSEAIPLVKAMLNYGAYTQLHFKYKTDVLANTSRYISDADKVLEDVDLSNYAYTHSGTQEGVTYDCTSLVLESETSIRHYFVFDNAEYARSLEATVQGKPVDIGEKDGYYTVEVNDIPAHKLDDLYTVTVGDFTLNYGVFSYGNLVLKSNLPDSLKNVIKALYEYNQAATAYKEGR
ncbi:MAG: hypothetical protein IKK10_02835 [Clostridia bacterium]|nr:hypothetical protein [Clostridia bacterium]